MEKEFATLTLVKGKETDRWTKQDNITGVIIDRERFKITKDISAPTTAVPCCLCRGEGFRTFQYPESIPDGETKLHVNYKGRGTWYPATIVEKEGNDRLKVHWDGFSKTSDKSFMWLDRTSYRIRWNARIVQNEVLDHQTYRYKCRKCNGLGNQYTPVVPVGEKCEVYHRKDKTWYPGLVLAFDGRKPRNKIKVWYRNRTTDVGYKRWVSNTSKYVVERTSVVIPADGSYEDTEGDKFNTVIDENKAESIDHSPEYLKLRSVLNNLKKRGLSPTSESP